MPGGIPEMLEEWRRWSIPLWRRVYQESLAQRDSRRAAYADWVLKCVLQEKEPPKEWEGLLDG